MKHTSKLKQYCIVLGRKALCYKRPETKRNGYVHPVFIGMKWFKSNAAALEFEEQFDC